MEDGSSLSFGFVDDVFVVIHRAETIDEREWGMCLTEARFATPLTPILIVPGEVMPNVSQRHDLAELLQHYAAQHAEPRDQLPRDQPSRDQPSRDQPSRDQLSRDQPSRDQPSRDQLSRDQPSRDQPLTMKVAMLSDSDAMPRVVTALKWAGIDAKGFAEKDLDGMLAFLERLPIRARMSSALGPYLERSWLHDVPAAAFDRRRASRAAHEPA